MNLYTQKQRWKIFLLVAALFIGATSLWYTNRLVKSLSEEEKKKVELWAEATRKLADINDVNVDLNFLSNVISNNTTIPVLLTDENGEIISYRNLDSLRMLNPEFALKELNLMKSQHAPIPISLFDGQKNFIYFKDSTILTNLRYYPYFQLTVIALFLLVSYLAFSSSRRAEQNQVWVGMAKETAHQLGTPLSSLIAWLEYLKLKGADKEYTLEIEKDVQRLQTITDRFSKIGSKPDLRKENIVQVMQHAIDYMQSRTSEKVHFIINNTSGHPLNIPLNIPLYEWVIENILKNAIDAMAGEGKITTTITDQHQYVYVDIHDSGKGIPKSAYKTVFKPGYTTKNRGWGLGLSLSKRIIEEYHNGQIFVKNSEANKGTTFRIVLRKFAV